MFSSNKAIVLGGLGGIGSSICQTLLNNNIDKLAIIDLADEVSEKFKSNNSVKYVQADMGDKDQLRRSLDLIWFEFEGFDIIINAAGIANERDPEKTFTINAVRIQHCRFL